MSQPSLVPLPIDPLVPEIREALEKRSAAVVVAEPGAGKTTRVPPALLSAAFARDKEIWVLQPRRLAAKLAALRVAEELGGEIGRQVGYQFRFEKLLGPQTRLRFMTDGMLLPLAQQDPTLSRVAAVILDEFHERSLELELGLGYLRRLQLGPRKDLRIVVMSATLDASTLSAYLDSCPIFKSQGRVFPVNVEYHPFPQEKELGQKVKSALRHLGARNTQGTHLVFLPGLAEIRQCERALQKDGLAVHALYGDLPVSEQQAVLRPSKGPKVILSTNLAETSLTVPGVTAVVDSGLTRQSRVSAWSGLSSLVTVPSSQASAAQRAGRAGRLQEGTCIRLYSKFDFEHRAAFDLPEILRSDLSQTLLDLKSLGAGDLDSFPWFLKPPPGSLEAAKNLLTRLGALSPQAELTSQGRQMALFPLPPRLAKFLLEAGKILPADSNDLRQACRLAALISEERPDSVDLLEELRAYKPQFEANKLEERLFGMFAKIPLYPPLLKGGRGGFEEQSTFLAKSLLAAFPDRVAKVRPGETKGTTHHGGPKRELLLSGGGSALAPDSPLTRGHDCFIVVEAQEMAPGGGPRPKEAGRTQVIARSLCPIEEDWLLDLFPDQLSEEEALEWNEKAKRVEGFKRLEYGELVLDEKPLGPSEVGPKAQELLFKEALAAGPAAYCDPEELASFRNRIQFVRQRSKDFPDIAEESIQKTLKELCGNARGFGDLKTAGLVAALRARLSPQHVTLLERLAPGQVTLPTGRKISIHYEEGKPPWGESRIQDFFGMREGPRVAGGEVPVVLHLLSPAKRPVQVTSDLAGFWKNHYPQIRKELSRRYPKHKWPENPF